MYRLKPALNTDKYKINPYAALVIGVIGVSFGALLARLSDAPALIIATYRNAFAAVLIAPLALAFRKTELKSISKKDLLIALGSGFFLALHFAVWISSLDYTSVASSVVLVTMQPLFVIVGSFFILKEYVPVKAVLAGLLAVTGSIVIGFGDFRLGGYALWGDFLALSGAIFIAGYVLIGRRLRQRFSLLAYTFIVYGTCSLILFIISIASGTPLFSYSAYNWVLFFSMALIPSILGHSTFNWALKHLPAPTVSVSILGEPVGASLLAFVFLKEIPTVLQLFGSGLILMGIYLFMKYSNG